MAHCPFEARVPGHHAQHRVLRIEFGTLAVQQVQVPASAHMSAQRSPRNRPESPYPQGIPSGNTATSTSAKATQLDLDAS